MTGPAGAPGPRAAGKPAGPRPLGGLRVLVTGASSGIGAALSRRLAGAGARVFGTGRDAAALAALEAGGAGAGAGAGGAEATLALDLTLPGAAGRLVEAAVGALGRLDVVVSNAGMGWAGPYPSMTPEEIDEVLGINLRAPMHLARAAAPFLEDGGQLVLVGSVAGLVGVPFEAAYSAAKFGLRGLADSLRAEWPGTTVTLVSPGAVQTPFFSRRNRPYERTWPRPMPVDKAVAAVVGAIERRRAEVVVPAWMTIAGRLSGAAPAWYRRVSRLPERFTR